MRLGRESVRILAAAIIMIVAYLAPSAVQAHAGHHHPSAAVTSSTEAVSAVPRSAATTVAVADADAGAVVVDAAQPRRDGQNGSCNGPCCCSSSGMMACCAHALVPRAGLPPRHASGRLSAPSDFLARPGVDPEALPKPPRAFA